MYSGRWRLAAAALLLFMSAAVNAQTHEREPLASASALRAASDGRRRNDPSLVVASAQVFSDRNCSEAGWREGALVLKRVHFAMSRLECQAALGTCVERHRPGQRGAASVLLTDCGRGAPAHAAGAPSVRLGEYADSSCSGALTQSFWLCVLKGARAARGRSFTCHPRRQAASCHHAEGLGAYARLSCLQTVSAVS